MKVTVTYTTLGGKEGVETFPHLPAALAWLESSKFEVEEYDIFFS